MKFYVMFCVAIQTAQHQFRYISIKLKRCSPQVSSNSVRVVTFLIISLFRNFCVHVYLNQIICTDCIRVFLQNKYVILHFPSYRELVFKPLKRRLKSQSSQISVKRSMKHLLQRECVPKPLSAFVRVMPFNTDLDLIVTWRAACLGLTHNNARRRTLNMHHSQ